MSIQCKAYLSQDGAKEATEIRNFRLDEGAASNYDYLRKKIATIFPNLGWDEDGSAFILRWKDSTGDMITFSSDEELVDALGQMPGDGVFRIYITHRKSNQDDFPWQQYVTEFWKSLKGGMHEQQSTAGRPSNSNPSAAGYDFSGRGCGRNKTSCGPQRRQFPSGFSFNSFPFPGLLAEVWGFPNDNDCFWQQCCSQTQTQTQGQETKPTQKSGDADKPSESSFS